MFKSKVGGRLGEMQRRCWLVGGMLVDVSAKSVGEVGC